MQTIDCIKTRRSIRKFSKKEVSLEILKKIVDCGRYAPDAFGLEPWEFMVLKDKELISELLEDRVQEKKDPYAIDSRKYAEKAGIEKFEKIHNPPAMIVLCGDKKRCDYTGSMLCSLSTAAENILLSAHDLGLGACWLYVYDPDSPDTEEKTKKMLKLPENILVLCFIIVGYPDCKLSSKKLRNLDEIIHINKW
jgi:nitroreductase